METPIYDNYSNHAGYLRWYRELLPIPLRVNNPSTAIPIEELAEPVLQSEYHCQMFNLNNPDDLKKYKDIHQRTLDGWYEIIDSRKDINSENGKFTVWMEWIQNYMEIDDGRI